METVAVVLEGPEQLLLRSLALHDPTPNDVVVDVSFSGISTGTERLLYSGRMPPFPGMGYPLVPGYESVGVVVEAGSTSGHRVGDTVFVPGSSAFKDARGLFGGAARRLITPASRVISLEPSLAEQGVLIALAATAYHAFAGGPPPELIVGHGVLGRLLARITVAQGAPPPVVWEKNADRRDGAQGYSVVDPDADTRRDYGAILDASGDATLLDGLVGRLAKGGEICLAGFYDEIRFTFPPAFMREARLRIASEWAPSDLTATMALVASGRLSLDGLITHHGTPQHANDAYRTAFSEPACLKMILDWRQCA